MTIIRQLRILVAAFAALLSYPLLAQPAAGSQARSFIDSTPRFVGSPAARHVASIPRLDALPAAEQASAKLASAGGAALIGVGRDFKSTGLEPLSSKDLSWQPISGGAVAYFEVAAAGARGMRVEFSAVSRASEVELRFKELRSPSRVVGPFALRSSAGSSPTWGPVVLGDVVEVEVFAPETIDTTQEIFQVTGISHLFDDRFLHTKVLGAAASCQRDVNCFSSSQNARENQTATAKMVFTKSDGLSYACSGTLLNTDPYSGTPYFLTSSICVADAAQAASINTFWHYESTSCGSVVPGAFVQRSGGASLLARSDTAHYAFVQLRDTVPSTVWYSGWDPSDPVVGSAVAALHHPQGDLKKMASGTATVTRSS